MRRTLVNLATVAIALLVSLAAGELVLKAVVPMPLKRVLPEVRYAHHPVRRFTLLPDQNVFTYGAPARIDARAFRSTGTAVANPGATILAVGDSFTFGLGVKDDETWPAQLQRELSGSMPNLEVVNAGTISYGVFQEMDLVRSQGLATKPRLLVHALYWNDFMNVGAPRPEAPPVVDAQGYFVWDQLSGSRGLARDMVSSSALYHSLRQAVRAMREPSAATTGYGEAYQRFLVSGLTDAEWQPIRTFYEDLLALGAEHDFAVVAVVNPVSDVVKMPAPRDHAYATAARRLLTELNIPFVDGFELLAAHPNRSSLFLPEGVDAHLNAAGYTAIAGALARTIESRSDLRARLVR